MNRFSFKTFYVAVSLLLFVIVTGIVGFSLIEHYNFTDALFMTIITISTVGFKEVEPLSPQGMYFTAFLIIVSFGIFAYAVTTLTRYVIDGEFRHYYKSNKVRRKIKSLKNHVIVCGYGRNGQQAVQELLEHNASIVVVEREEEVLDKILEIPDLLYVQGDSTQDETLDACNVKSAKALISALPLDSDNLYVVLSARELNPDLTIISRASDEQSNRKLKRAGATNVIMPDKIGGQRMAKLGCPTRCG
jgi:voltage-gated potassium channel